MNAEHLQPTNGTGLGALSAAEIDMQDRLIEETQAKNLTEVLEDGKVASTAWVSLNFRSEDGKRFIYVDVAKWPERAVRDLLGGIKKGFVDYQALHEYLWKFYAHLPLGLSLIPKDLLPQQATPRIKTDII